MNFSLNIDLATAACELNSNHTIKTEKEQAKGEYPLPRSFKVWFWILDLLKYIVPSLIPPPWSFKKILIPFCLHPVSMYDNKSQMNFEVFFPSKWRMSPIKQNFKQNDWCRVFYVIYDEHICMYIYSDAKSS